MFDMEAEELFVENCMRVLKGKTVILISHRLETLAIADRVVRLGRRGTSNSIEPDYSFSDLKAS